MSFWWKSKPAKLHFANRLTLDAVAALTKLTAATLDDAAG